MGAGKTLAANIQETSSQNNARSSNRHWQLSLNVGLPAYLSSPWLKKSYLNSIPLHITLGFGKSGLEEITSFVLFATCLRGQLPDGTFWFAPHIDDQSVTSVGKGCQHSHIAVAVASHQDRTSTAIVRGDKSLDAFHFAREHRLRISCIINRFDMLGRYETETIDTVRIEAQPT